MNRLIIAITALATACFAAGPLPDLTITFGEQNTGAGLAVPSAGDGVNESVTVGGQSARRITGDRSLYLYVIINHPAYTRGSHDVYVTAEVFDDVFCHLSPSGSSRRSPTDIAIRASSSWCCSASAASTARASTLQAPRAAGRQD